jgi:lysophospholipase L1-like esterase
MEHLMKPLISALAFLLASTSAGAAETRVLVYGDSNSWGWIPVESAFPTRRYDDAVRWPGVLEAQLTAALGPTTVVVDALSGRTVATGYPEVTFGLPGAEFAGLPGLRAAIAEELPLDAVVIMLGTNDARSDLALNPEEVAAGIAEMVTIVRTTAGGIATDYPDPKVVVIAPPAIGETSRTPIDGIMQGATAKSQAIAAAIVEAGEQSGFDVLDAGEVVTVGGIDGVHFLPEDHTALGQAVAARLVGILIP